EYAFVVHVTTDDGIIRARARRLFIDRNNDFLVQRRNAEAFRISDLLEQDARTALLPPEVIDVRSDRIFEDIVAEQNDDTFARSERFRQRQRMRDAVSFLLDPIGEFTARSVERR